MKSGFFHWNRTCLHIDLHILLLNGIHKEI